jgi:hypothetical protein
MRKLLCEQCNQRRPIFIRRRRIVDLFGKTKKQVVVAADREHSLCLRCHNSVFEKTRQAQLAVA